MSGFGGQMESSEKQIKFQTEDGWTIYGSLHLPATASADAPAPAALLLHAAGHDRDAFTSFVYPGMAQLLNAQGVAALRIDWRGRGESIGPQEYHSFTEAQKEKIRFDVQAALNFMSEQSEIDANRLAVFAEEVSSEWAVTGTVGDPRVKALSFLSGRISEQTREILATNSQMPVQCVVSKEDKPGFEAMSAVYSRTESRESDFKVYENMGMGTTMFTVWRYHYPDKKGVEFLAKNQGVDTEKIGLVPRDPGNEKPIEEVICNWISARLKAIGSVKEVSFKTEDGWTIYGNLRIPENIEAGQRVPGVVLLHSGWSDRYIFHGLEIVCARLGVAVLNIDWRGRGKSREKGNYFTLPREERDRAYLDAKAAVNLLADQPGVDAGSIAILGTYLGAKLAVMAAMGDPRIGALVMLSGYIPSAKERDEIATINFPILFIGSRGFAPVTNAIFDLYELTREKGSEVIIYDGGAIGYQLFEVDEGLEHRIVSWIKAKLKARTNTEMAVGS